MEDLYLCDLCVVCVVCCVDVNFVIYESVGGLY